MTEARLKHFGWGRDGERLTAAEENFAVARYRSGSASRPSSSASRRRSRISNSARRASRRRRRWRRSAPASPTTARAHLRQVLPRLLCAASPATTPTRRTSSPIRATTADIAAVMDWAGGAQAAVDPVRRRLAAWSAASSRALGAHAQGGGHHRPARPRPRAGDRQHLARRAHRGRHVRPGARGAAAAARADAAAFPAELRVFDAGRLDRDALGRPFRHALHPYRRFRRKPARGDAARPHRDAAAARLRRRAEPRPHVHRLRGHSRHHHRGVDAAAGPAALPRRRRGALQGFLHRRAGGARDRARPGSIPPTAASSIPKEALQHRRRRRHAARSWCWRSNPATSRSSLDGRALECCADHGGTPEAAEGATRTREGAAGQWRNAFIRMPLCAREDGARAASSPTRSRPRSPGTGSRRSTTRSRRRPSAAIRESTGRPGQVTCRFTHVYPDGPAPYFTLPRARPARRAGRAMAGDQRPRRRTR